jgi:putative ABC transport system permease protein
LGYIPAFAAGSGLYRITQSATKVPVIMDGPKALLVFVLILVICMGSALLAMRKLADADPAEIF